MYGLGGGLFFLSYALCEVPSNVMLMRFGARRWIARIMFTWELLGGRHDVRQDADAVLRHAFFSARRKPASSLASSST